MRRSDCRRDFIIYFRAMSTIIFGGGCFWCIEAVFRRLKGVTGVMSGYAGGDRPEPSYETVSRGNSGHAEVVRVEFDPAQITLDQLLAVFFTMHDPTTMNRQGGDVGEQYRSVIFYTDEVQKPAIEAYKQKLEKDGVFDAPIVTAVEKAPEFYPAEDYHQSYYENNPQNPYCAAIISPKLGKLRKEFSHLLRD